MLDSKILCFHFSSLLGNRDHHVRPCHLKPVLPPVRPGLPDLKGHPTLSEKALLCGKYERARIGIPDQEQLKALQGAGGTVQCHWPAKRSP